MTSPRTPVEDAELALLLEVAGTPKPGNVDRHRDYSDLRFEHFLAGAVGARRGLALASESPVGEAFERAIKGMSYQQGGNTQFGAVLILVPLVRAASETSLHPAGVDAVVSSTTVDDAVAFYRSFDHVDVAVKDPPEGLDALDVRRGGAAEEVLRERGLTLADIMSISQDVDGVATEWVAGFERTFAAADWLLNDTGPIPDRTARAFLRLLANEVDSFIIKTNSRAHAEEATRRANAALAGNVDPEVLAEEFVERGINPGTTADLTAGALFIALQRGLPL
jgi:triphosphoribosyl-dephospho-CoA synthase